MPPRIGNGNFYFFANDRNFTCYEFEDESECLEQLSIKCPNSIGMIHRKIGHWELNGKNVSSKWVDNRKLKSE